jgi:hypothetical protein
MEWYSLVYRPCSERVRLVKAIRYQDATPQQLEEVIEQLDNLSPRVIRWLLDWTEGEHQEWLIEYDLGRWKKGNWD